MNVSWPCSGRVSRGRVVDLEHVVDVVRTRVVLGEDGAVPHEKVLDARELEPAHRAHPRHTSTAAALMWGGESPRGREWAHLLAGVAAPSMESSMEAKALGSNMTSAI